MEDRKLVAAASLEVHEKDEVDKVDVNVVVGVVEDEDADTMFVDVEVVEDQVVDLGEAVKLVDDVHYNRKVLVVGTEMKLGLVEYKYDIVEVEVGLEVVDTNNHHIVVVVVVDVDRNNLHILVVVVFVEVEVEVDNSYNHISVEELEQDRTEVVEVDVENNNFRNLVELVAVVVEVEEARYYHHHYSIVVVDLHHHHFHCPNFQSQYKEEHNVVVQQVQEVDENIHL